MWPPTRSANRFRKIRPALSIALPAAVLVLAAIARPVAAACPPDGWPRERLVELKAAQWKLDDAARRNALARSLADCLSDRDPLLRDGIAFEALSAWMRGSALEAATMRALLETLQPLLLEGRPDPDGFARPFAALTLSEIARADRVAPFLSTAERDALVAAAAGYESNVRDYRGFDDRDGWRHGVAHGADLLLQLALNPGTGEAHHRRMLAAIASQVSPDGGHAYVFGEPERLARPVLFIARRGTVDGASWVAWMRSVAGPGPFGEWSRAVESRAGLARRHNVAAFVLALYASLRESSDGAAKELLLPPVIEALHALP
jgi:hypothetical protein